MKTYQDPEKKALFEYAGFALALFLGLFLSGWMKHHNLLRSAFSAAIGAIGGVAAGLIFVMLWARTKSLIIASVITACGWAALLYGLVKILGR